MIDDLRILLSRSTLGENNDDVLQKKANAINEFIKDSDSISQYTDLVKFVYSPLTLSMTVTLSELKQRCYMLILRVDFEATPLIV